MGSPPNPRRRDCQRRRALLGGLGTDIGTCIRTVKRAAVAGKLLGKQT